jgi:hypothetical protein
VIPSLPGNSSSHVILAPVSVSRLKTLQKHYKNITKTLQKHYKNITKTLQFYQGAGSEIDTRVLGFWFRGLDFVGIWDFRLRA